MNVNTLSVNLSFLLLCFTSVLAENTFPVSKISIWIGGTEEKSLLNKKEVDSDITLLGLLVQLPGDSFHTVAALVRDHVWYVLDLRSLGSKVKGIDLMEGDWVLRLNDYYPTGKLKGTQKIVIGKEAVKALKPDPLKTATSNQ